MTFRLIETEDDFILADDTLPGDLDLDLACDDAEHDDRFEWDLPDGIIADDDAELVLIDDDDPADDAAAIAAACRRHGVMLAELPY